EVALAHGDRGAAVGAQREVAGRQLDLVDAIDVARRARVDQVLTRRIDDELPVRGRLAAGEQESVHPFIDRDLSFDIALPPPTPRYKECDQPTSHAGSCSNVCARLSPRRAVDYAPGL